MHLTVADTIWFVDNGAPACTLVTAGCGRLASPFSSLAAFAAANGGALVNGGDVVSPEPGDRVFIHTGIVAYAGPLVLANGQRAAGQGTTLPLADALSIAVAPDSVPLPSTGGTAPLVTGSTGVTLARDNAVAGLAFSTTGTAIGTTAPAGTLALRDVTIANTSGGGISLTGGGVVGIQGTNVVRTTTGVPVRISDTAMAAAGATFREISANGAPAGIVLANTGTSGRFTVTGTGQPASGGTIQNITTRGASFIGTGPVSLTDMRFVAAATTNGADPGDAASGCGDLALGGNLACNAALHFAGVSRGPAVVAVSLVRVAVDGSAQVGLNLNAVDGLSMFDSTIAGAGDEVREYGIKGRNVTGAVSILDSTITGSFADNVRIDNGAGTADVSVVRSTFSGASLGGGLFYLLRGPASATLGVTASTFANNFTTGLLAGMGDPAATGTAIIDVAGGAFTGNNAGLQVIGAGSAQIRVDLSHNAAISGNPAGGIVLDLSDTSTPAARLIGTIASNTVTMPAFGSGNGIGMSARGAGTVTLRVADNTITNTSQHGIHLHGKEGAAPGALNVTVTGNRVTTVDAPSDLLFPIDGIRVEAGAASTDGGTVCAHIADNTVTGANSQPDAPGADLRLRHRFATTFVLPGLTGPLAADAMILLGAQNPAAALVDATTTTSFTAGGSCPVP